MSTRYTNFRTRARRCARLMATIALVVAGLAAGSAEPAVAGTTCGTYASPAHHVYDGGFEKTLTAPGWGTTAGVMQPRSLLGDPQYQPYEGNWFARLDRDPVAIPTLRQVVQLPAGCMKYYLRFAVHVGSTQPPPPAVNPDRLVVTLSTYGSTNTPWSKSWTFSNMQAYPGYYGTPQIAASIGLPIDIGAGPSTGGLFWLKFEGWEASQLLTAPHTWFNIDNVDLSTIGFG